MRSGIRMRRQRPSADATDAGRVDRPGRDGRSGVIHEAGIRSSRRTDLARG